MVSGIPVDGPVGRVAVTGPHPADDQAEVHPLRRREHSSRTARSSTKQVTCRAAKQKAANAWGYVIRIGDRIFYDHGVTPTWLVQIFATRKAYIYMVEILAQLVAFVTFGAKLPAAIIAFIDNTAGQGALTKGYGRDGAVNGMISAFWSLAARQGGSSSSSGSRRRPTSPTPSPSPRLKREFCSLL